MWRVFFVPNAVSRTDNVLPLHYLRAADEGEARGFAMRFHQAGVKRIVVRPPDGAAMIAGLPLEEWLTDRLSGRVSG
jgi:hypothetical protein